MPAVPDASPLIALGKIERVELLPKLYGVVMITPWVFEEAITQGKRMGAQDAAYLERSAKEFGFIRVKLTATESRLAQRLKDEGSGSGEAEVMAVARSRKALAILDDKDARSIATAMDVARVGTAGMFFEAFLHNLLDYEELLELMEKFGKVAWASPDLLAGIIRRAREVRKQ